MTTTIVMPSNPSSPTTPSRRRRSLRLSSSDNTQISIGTSPFASSATNGTSLSRQSSRTSQTSYQHPSPKTPRRMSSTSSRYAHVRKSSRNSINSVVSLETAGQDGLGNLADELGDAWGQDEGEQGSSLLEELREGVSSPEGRHDAVHSPMTMMDLYDFGFGMPVPSPAETLHIPILSSPKKSRSEAQQFSHKRTESAYDGSDYGPESDEEDQSIITPSLAKRIRDIESLARMGVNSEDSLSEQGGVIKRTTRALKDLGSQADVEAGVTRLITAYTSMATHRTHKTRDLFSQAHSLLYGGVLDCPDEVINLLLEEIETLRTSLPFLSKPNPLLSLQILASQTADLTQTLRSLTDVLQESRIAANGASRKLKSVRDMVEELSREEELIETSIMLIQAGDWDRRCRERHAARTCREVVEGFAKTWSVPLEGSSIAWDDTGIQDVPAHEIGVAF